MTQRPEPTVRTATPGSDDREALAPVGAHDPRRWPADVHRDPEEAVRAAREETGLPREHLGGLPVGGSWTLTRPEPPSHLTPPPSPASAATGPVPH